MNLKIGDKVKVLLARHGNFDNKYDYELGVIRNISDVLGYFVEFEDKRFVNSYYDIEDLQKIENIYVSKDKIRNKINDLRLKNKIPIKDQFVMYDVIKRDFQIEILVELLNEEDE